MKLGSLRGHLDIFSETKFLQSWYIMMGLDNYMPHFSVTALPVQFWRIFNEGDTYWQLLSEMLLRFYTTNSAVQLSLYNTYRQKLFSFLLFMQYTYDINDDGDSESDSENVK